MTTDARLAWIDTLKGLGIVVVVMAHHPALWAYSEALCRAAFSFHIPLFFFITGLTLPARLNPPALATRMLGALIPYFVLALASLPAVMYLYPGTASLDVLLGIVYGTGHTIYNVPLWFLPCLAVSLGFVYLLDRIVPASAAAQLAAFVTLQCAWQLSLAAGYELKHGAGWGTPLASGLPWSSEVALAGAGYVVLGRLFGQHFKGSRWTIRPQWVAALAAALLFVGLNALLRPQVDLNWRYDRPLGFSPFIAMAGILMVVLTAVSLPKGVATRMLGWLGTSTILILWAHQTLEKGFYKVMAPQLGSLAAFIASIAVALLLPALAQLVVKRIPLLNILLAPNALLKKLFLGSQGGSRPPHARTGWPRG